MSLEKHLLVIRLSAMGDVAMTVPIITALVQQYPEVKVTVLTRAFFKPLFEQIPNVTVYETDVKGEHKGVLGLWRLFKMLKKLELHAIADLHNVLRSNILKLFFKFSGFKVIQIDKGRTEKKALTRASNRVFKLLKTTHQRYADVFESLGYPLDLTTAVSLLKREVSEGILDVFASQDKKRLGIAPFAAFEGKMYPLDLMEQVVSKLNELNGYQIILFGGGKKEGQQLANWENKFENCTSIVGKYTFSEELDLISKLDLMVAMDSGNAHLAANYSVPVVSLWGVTHPYAGFYPFNQKLENALMADREKYPLIPTSVYGNKIPPGYTDAMRTIHPKDVINKVIGILKK